MSKHLFIGQVCDVEIQKQLIRAWKDLDNTMDLSLECEKRRNSSAQFQNLLPHKIQGSEITKIKDEPA